MRYRVHGEDATRGSRAPFLVAMAIAALGVAVAGPSSTPAFAVEQGPLAPSPLPLASPAAQTYDADQLIVVTGARIGSTTGTLRVLNLVNGAWVERLSAPARFGKRGLIDGTVRSEGSNTTPTGIWRMPGYLFGTHAQAPAGSRMGYRQITPNSWWSRKAGATYNNWVEASSWPGERLADSPSAYEFAVSTGYNAAPNECVYGRGTAIFLHVQGPGLTAGCVSIPRSDMVRVCALLDPALRPGFAIGTLGNGDATGIDQYLKSVNSVRAGIDSVAPSPATTDTLVAFAGHASDPKDGITAWQWRSTIDGVLATNQSFSKKLSLGIHGIYLQAMCARGMWSPEVGTWLVVGAQGTHPLPVYRFYNVKTGTHFYTASEAEKNGVIARLSATYRLEGVAYALDASAPANRSPLYRFYNVRKGVHFYTADESEKNRILKSLGSVYHYDGVAFNVSLTSTGFHPVYRFYNLKQGVHFYTADPAERDNVISKLRGVYRYEGTAYYYATPW